MTSLKKRTIKGLIWSGIDSYGIYFFKFAFSIFIARLLNPEDYGLIGMIAIFIALGTMITDSGFQASILQKKNPQLRDYSSVFVLKVSISVLIYLILFFTAPLIANFYNEPRLIDITKVMSLGLVFGAFSGIQQTWFIKNMNFKGLTKINFISTIVSGGIGVIIAYIGFGVWALVFQTLAGNMVRATLLWIFSNLKIPFYFSWSALKGLYSYGWKMFMQSFLDTIFKNIYYPLIGRYFDVASLGFYTNARRFQHLAIVQTNGAISKVLFPAFASIQDNPEKISKASKQSVRLVLFILYPIITILILTADPFVSFFLTIKWMPAVPYMQLLYLFGFIIPIYALNINALNAIGKSSITLKLSIFNKILVIISIFIGINFGISGLIIAHLVTSIITYLIGTQIFSTYINYNLVNQLIDILTTLLISGCSYFIAKYIFINLHTNDFILLAGQSFTVIFVYYLFMKILKPRTYSEFKNLVSKLIPQKIRFIL